MADSQGLALGVDVGTSSARAGLFDPGGRMVGHGASPLETSRPSPDLAEQSSDDIWRASCRAVREALDSSGARPERVAGLGFDATSSLVALDASDRPVTVSPGGDDRWNVIVWMDHRAIPEAEAINATGHEVLRYVGGRLSPEMAPPKLRWLKTRLPSSWRRSARFLELPDFLTYRSTGIDARSMCTAVCKWTYLGHEGRWAGDFFERIGLPDLLQPGPGGSPRAGREVKPLGTRLGGLTPKAAEELGLRPGTPVGVGIIDAHAGGLGLLGAASGDLERVVALIGGTSSCHMAVSPDPRFIPGIWGPYYSAMVPGMWLTEGGQSASGSLIDHVIEDAGAAGEARRRAREEGKTVYEALNDRLARLEEAEPGKELTSDLHVLPYFHGNRSPRADPSLRGVLSGLPLDATLDALARRYLASIQAVAHGTRHIIESLNAGGYRIEAILACGGGTRNPVWLREHADATGCRLVLPREPEAVLLGSALLGAVAAGTHPSVLHAMAAMGGSEKTVEPDPRRRVFHERKYRVFHRMYDHFQELRKLMAP